MVIVDRRWRGYSERGLERVHDDGVLLGSLEDEGKGGTILSEPVGVH